MDLTPIRASSLGELFDCARRWEFKYIKGLRGPKSGAAQFGTAIHAAAATWDQARIDGTDLTLAAVFAVFSGDMYNPREEVDWDGVSVDELIPIGTSLLRKYCKDVSPLFDWVGVEVTCEGLDITDLGIQLTGSTDRIYRANDGRLGICDLKTGKAAVGSDGKAHAGRHAVQLGAYEILAGASLGMPIEAPAVVIGFQNAKTETYRRVGTGEVEGAWQLLVGDDENLGLLQYADRILSSGLFPPNPSSSLCSAKYCPGYGQCPSHR